MIVRNDRLPALSGLAKQFAVPYAGRYLAKIWYSQLPDGLDWIVKNAKKPDGYRAPSWCWVSLNEPDEYSTHGGAREIEIIEPGYTPAGEDPYGEVSDGYIIVKGEFGRVNKAWHEKEDYDVVIDEDEEMWALKLNSSDWNIWHSLLLRRSTRVQGAWESVGLETEGNSCFEGRGKTIVKIV